MKFEFPAAATIISTLALLVSAVSAYFAFNSMRASSRATTITELLNRPRVTWNIDRIDNRNFRVAIDVANSSLGQINITELRIERPTPGHVRADIPTFEQMADPIQYNAVGGHNDVEPLKIFLPPEGQRQIKAWVNIRDDEAAPRPLTVVLSLKVQSDVDTSAPMIFRVSREL